MLFEHGADPNKAALPNGQLPLITAIMKEYETSLRRNSWLFPNNTSCASHTAVSNAMKKDSISLLLFYGASISSLPDQLSTYYPIISWLSEKLIDRLTKREQEITQGKLTVCRAFAEACNLPADIGEIIATFFNHRELEQVRLTCRRVAGWPAKLSIDQPAENSISSAKL